ncbi:hypothetical protein, partial [Pedobacter sp. UBA4863]|uniref:hypothetical protein n=1 Tax=Pedobacter sp. UBA4863 TaxID=1947060 RepID=UPI0025F1B965
MNKKIRIIYLFILSLFLTTTISCQKDHFDMKSLRQKTINIEKNELIGWLNLHQRILTNLNSIN